MNKYQNKVCRCTNCEGHEYIGVCRSMSKHTFTFDLLQTTNPNWKHKMFTWDRTDKKRKQPEILGDIDDYPEYFI